jgi:hypothetical protein
MAREELEIEISPDGRVTLKTIGIKGARCIDVAEMLARIIGREEQRELTSEYYETGIDTRQNQRVDVWNQR